jgi:hypothetical protein
MSHYAKYNLSPHGQQTTKHVVSKLSLPPSLPTAFPPPPPPLSLLPQNPQYSCVCVCVCVQAETAANLAELLTFMYFGYMILPMIAPSCSEVEHLEQVFEVHWCTLHS